MDVTTDPQPKCMQSDASNLATLEPSKKSQWRRAFLKALSLTGNATESAKMVGKDLSYVFKVRKRSATFGQAWQNALKLNRRRLVDRAEKALETRAIDGWLEPVFQNGVKVGSKRKFSDANLALVCKANARKKYATYSESKTHSSSHVLVTVESRTRMLTDPGYADLICQLDAITAQPAPTSLALPCPVDSTEGEITA